MELVTTYTRMKYTLTVSSYQGAILLQFNVGGDSLTYDEIEKATELDAATLTPTLALLVKQKVLTQKGDTYDLNLGQCSLKHIPLFEVVDWYLNHRIFSQISSQRKFESTLTCLSSLNKRPNRLMF